MIDYHRPVEPFGAQTQRLAAEAQWGAAAHAGRRATAMARFAHAASYFRQSELYRKIVTEAGIKLE